MKITLSAAMRARDVSMPSAGDIAEAECADQRAPTAKNGGVPGGRRGPWAGGKPVPPNPAPTPPPGDARSSKAQDGSAPDEGGQDKPPRGNTGRSRRSRSRTRRGQRQ